jgi:hypothetical protein
MHIYIYIYIYICRSRDLLMSRKYVLSSMFTVKPGTKRPQRAEHVAASVTSPSRDLLMSRKWSGGWRMMQQSLSSVMVKRPRAGPIGPN